MPLFPATLALTLPEYPTLADSLQYQLTGFLVVVFTLGSLAALVGLLGRIFAALDKRRGPAGAAAKTALPAHPAAPGDEISPAILAAIAGAVAAALGDSRFAIRSVQMADPRQNLVWSAEGRRSIYASRHVR
ncbi:MAG: OadG family transporter subunit [Chthoniobacterales bacterium]